MFQYMDGPNTGFDGPLPTTPTFSGDTATYSGMAVKNFSDHVLPDVGVWNPFLWVRLADGTREVLDWDNTRHGWYTPNFISDNGPTGESLLLTLSISSDTTHITNRPLRAGNVADSTGDAQYPLSSTATPVPFPLETINQNDLLPFGDLGAFAAGQVKTINLSVTAHWGGADLGPVRTNGFLATLESDNPHRGGARIPEMRFSDLED